MNGGHRFFVVVCFWCTCWNVVQTSCFTGVCRSSETLPSLASIFDSYLFVAGGGGGGGRLVAGRDEERAQVFVLLLR